MLAAYPNVRRWEDTDDVFQNAAVRLHRALAAVTPRSPRELVALAATQLHRELVDLARRHAGPRSPAAHHATNLVAGGGGESVHFRVDRAAAPDDGIDRWGAFHEAIAALSPEEREVFHLVWYLGADQRTVARLLDCSPRTVKSRWRRAREAVRAALDGHAPA
jgi:RNA polymerase sigma-70 factor (ECF subfamily)